MARLRRRIPTWSPTLDTLGLFWLVFLAQAVVGLLIPVGGVPLAATPPPWHDPWTLATAVYAHASFSHVLANSLGLLLVGPLVERTAGRLRFHAFFLGTGAVSTVVDLLVGTSGVVGGSGAVFGLLGYLLAGNPVSRRLLDRLALPARAQIILLAGVAGVVTLLGAGPGIALVAHFTGLLVGLLAGRMRLLATR
jgi:membrane associated rhomboid family serine protease